MFRERQPSPKDDGEALDQVTDQAFGRDGPVVDWDIDDAHANADKSGIAAFTPTEPAAVPR